jgi:hypothetical protein
MPIHAPQISHTLQARTSASDADDNWSFMGSNRYEIQFRIASDYDTLIASLPRKDGLTANFPARGYPDQRGCHMNFFRHTKLIVFAIYDFTAEGPGSPVGVGYILVDHGPGTGRPLFFFRCTRTST